MIWQAYNRQISLDLGACLCYFRDNNLEKENRKWID